ncbi:Aste57867_14282 [Aphanomyces stellatus]|uniref:Aste57867_14282 protein n=1 Tax=Aphanomyces stellatus TaxID=120398 RepID=A0A485L091_9STRA|nr:hypothetical protein As57867_014230 [Aphanomyces stellatus]VFT91107.1 Aste57867_14282 [Aphanomyces stellatus]
MPTPSPSPIDASIAAAEDLVRGNASMVLSTTLKIYGPLIVGGFVLFEILRRCAPYLFNCKPHDVPSAIGRWIPYVWSVSDDEIMETCGLDSLLFLRFIRVGKHLAGFAILLSIGLFPAYSSKKLLQKEDFLDRLTISGLPRNDARLWATVVAAIAMSFFTMYCISRECQTYKERRHQFLARAGTQQYSVLIDDIPSHLRSHTSLKKYFNALFPRQVQFCYIAVECRDLERLVAVREGTRNALEHALVQLAQTRTRPTHYEWRGGCAFESVDSISTHEANLARLNDDVAVAIREIEAQQKHGSFYFNSITLLPDEKETTATVTPPSAKETTPLLPSSSDSRASLLPDLTGAKILRRSAFVTFSTLQATNTVQQIVQTATPHEMRIQEAPPAADIVWANVGTLNYEQRQFWTLVAIGATAVLTLFWTVPTTLVVALSSVDSLRRVIPHLNDILDQFPYLESLLQQLSPVGLVLMNHLVPLLLRLVSRAEGHASTNSIEASTFTKVVTFQLVQTFFVASVAGSLTAIADKVQLVLEQPLQVVPMLGSSIPGQSTLFASYILVHTGLSLSMSLLRTTPLLLGALFAVAAPSLTARERAATSWYGLARATVPGHFDVTLTLAQQFLVLLLVLTFAPLAPVVSWVGGLFFVVSDVVYRRLMLCVYASGTQSTGLHWPQLYSFLIIALLLSQGTLVGVLTLKQAPSQVVVALVLPCITALFHWWIRQLYPSVSEYLPVELCVALDQARHAHPPTLVRTLYKQPAMAQKAPLVPDDPTSTAVVHC